MNNDRRITVRELLDDVKSKSGRATGWPNYFVYGVDGSSVTISANNKALDKKATRRLDPWGLAFLAEAEHRCGIKINDITFAVSGTIDETRPAGRLVPNLEAFRRRVSFLSINNPNLGFVITFNGRPLELDDADMLFARPENELIHERIDREARPNPPGRLEKDFQTWLSANDSEDTAEQDAKTNVRLAVLGEDFFKLRKKNVGIIREFPTGAFDKGISTKLTERSRILPTDFIDIVTLNKYGQLAVIELKLNDSQLEVIAQLMDYSLFFTSYRDRLWRILEEKLRATPKSNEIICYVVNNYFHKRFDDVLSYYNPRDDLHGFRIKKVLLGHYSQTPLRTV